MNEQIVKASTIRTKLEEVSIRLLDIKDKTDSIKDSLSLINGNIQEEINVPTHNEVYESNSIKGKINTIFDVLNKHLKDLELIQDYLDKNL